MQIQLNHNSKINSPIQKWAKELNGHYAREVTEMVKQHMKRCSTSVVAGETQVKTTVRYHLTPVGLANFFFFNEKNKCWKDVEKLKSLCIADGNKKQSIYHGKQFCPASKS